MITGIKVMSRGEATLKASEIGSKSIIANMDCDDLLVVSIFRTGSKPPVAGIHVRSYQFDDVKHNEDLRFKFMSEEQALNIIKRLREVNDAGKRYFVIIQCENGRSLSGAVAEYGRRMAGISRQELLNENPRIWPNPSVLERLLEISGRGHEEHWNM